MTRCNPNRRRRLPGSHSIEPRGQQLQGSSARRRIGRPFSSTLASSCALLSMLPRAHADSAALPPIPAQPTERALQGLIIGAQVDLDACYANLRAADANGDGKLSPDEFLDFVQSSADGKLDVNEYGIPITEFYMLSQEFIGIYNFFACGNANYGCPSVVGIDIAGVGEGFEGSMTEQQETFVYQLCKLTEGGVGSLPEPGATDSPTGGTAVPPTGAPTSPTTPATSTPPTKSAATTAPTPPLLPPCPPLFDEMATYGPGDQVSDGGNYYQCRPFPQSGWCDQGGYEVGNSINWPQAWMQLGQCDPGDVATAAPAPPSPKPIPAGTTSPTPKPVFPTYSPTASGGAATSSPSLSPTPKPTAEAIPVTPPPTPKPVSGDDDLYSGLMSTTFQYEIYNTQNLNAQSIMSGGNPENAAMAVILQSTTDFVEGVVDFTFGSAASQMEGGVDHDKGNLRHRMLQRSVRQRFHRQTRTLLVTLPPNSVSIDNVEDVACSDTSLPTRNCQRVTAAASLALVNEQMDDTALQFQNALSRALENPGIAYPSDSGIVYAGPATTSDVVVIPGVTDPGDSEGQPPPEDGGGGTPSWVVPVSIGAAAVGSILLVLFVGHRVQKRKRWAKEYDGPRQASLEGDLAGDGSASSDAEMQLGPQAKISPLDTPAVEDGRRVSRGSSNPFLDDSSSSSSSPSSSSGSSASSSTSAPSGSYSQSISSESSSEGIANVAGEADEKDQYWKERDEYWKNKEAEAVVQLRDNDPKTFWKAKEEEMKQHQQQPKNIGRENEAGAAKGPPPPPDEQPQDYNRLHTLEEGSKEDLAQSGWSLVSGASQKSDDKSVYRAGVEALVKEACPERLGELDTMMVEYEGREEVLIGHLSTMLAAKNRSELSSSGASSSEDERNDLDASSRSYETGGSDTSGYVSSSASEWTSSTGAAASFGVRGSHISSLNTSSSNSGQEKDDQIEAPAPATMEVTVTSPATAAAATSLLSSMSPTDDLRSSSSTGSSGWSSDDGLSSIDTSSHASSEVPNQITGAPLDQTLAAIGEASAVSQRVTGYSGSAKPTFIPVDGPDDDTETAERSTDAQVATRKDLDDAINAGDWKAVGATAALIANLSPSNSQDKSDEDFNESNVSVTSHEKHQVEELEKLVEAGDWNAVMQAATRYEGVSDSDHKLLDSKQDLNYQSSKESTPEKAEEQPSRESLRAEIEELVRTVVPEELDNLDEMLLQFKDREEELITTLQTYKESSTTEEGNGSSSNESFGSPLPLNSSHTDADGSATVFTDTNASLGSGLE